VDGTVGTETTKSYCAGVAFRERDMAMMVNCVQVWREISNYLEGDVDANLASAIEMHFRDCKHCKAVLDGTRNVIQLYGDERVIEPPLGFRRRLQRRLQGNLQPKRRSLLGWMAGAAAAVLVVGGLEIGTFSVFNYPDLRSRHASAGGGSHAT
jgi:hypothetical protein